MRSRLAPALATLMLLAASTVLAQNPPPGGPGGPGGPPGGGRMGERRMRMMMKDITLTAAQQAKVDSIRAKYRGMMPAMTAGTPPDSATRQKMRDLFRKMDDEIRAVLTPDQQKLWDRNIGELRERRPRGP